jgi:16S rRNA (uracil1498-N3)-methyltransferase
VTAPLYLVNGGALEGVGPGEALTLEGEEGRHAATVRRTRIGEELLVADGEGALARCRVEAVAPARLELRVEDMIRTPPARPALVLVQALAKGGRDELAVETATELGVDAVVPWQAERSVVVWSGERGERARRKWEAVVRAAGKQSRRAVLPRVREPVTTAGLVRAVAGAAGVLVLHEDAPTPLAGMPLPAEGTTGELWVVVGPEGGISAAELEAFAAAGAQPVRLGPHVLRSSSAGAAALAVLATRLGRWG